jgi:hypothetical protein
MMLPQVVKGDKWGHNEDTPCTVVCAVVLEDCLRNTPTRGLTGGVVFRIDFRIGG